MFVSEFECEYCIIGQSCIRSLLFFLRIWGGPFLLDVLKPQSYVEQWEDSPCEPMASHPHSTSSVSSYCNCCFTFLLKTGTLTCCLFIVFMPDWWVDNRPFRAVSHAENNNALQYLWPNLQVYLSPISVYRYIEQWNVFSLGPDCATNGATAPSCD